MKQTILELLKNREFLEAARMVYEMPIADKVDILISLDDDTLIPFCNELDNKVLADCIGKLDKENQQRIIDEIKQGNL